jgi:outer membrane protein assembly factor BamB
MIRTLTAACTVVAFLSATVSCFSEAAQPANSDFSKAIKLPDNSRVQSNLDLLPLYAGGDGWSTYVEILQDILDAPDDSFVAVERPGPAGKAVAAWVGARAEAMRLIAALPKDGLAAYAALTKLRSKDLLDEARRQGDRSRLEEVARRYPLTPSGVEAVRLLGLHYLDRSKVEEAVRWFELWRRRDAEWFKDGVGSFAAWMALERAGQVAEAESVWKSLQSHHGGGVMVGDRKVSLATLKKQFQVDGAAKAAPEDWLLYGGNAVRRRSATGLPVPALQWKVRSVPEGSVPAGLLENAISFQEGRGQPVLSASFPIAVGKAIVFRAADGIRAVSATSGEPLWHAAMPLSLDRILASMRVEAWINSYLSIHPHSFLENSTLGCLSSDNKRVYAIDDLPFLQANVGLGAAAKGKKVDLLGVPGVPTSRNRLRALDVATGKAVWQFGTSDPTGVTATPEGDCYFLGPPLPWLGKLYSIAEQDGALVLLSIEASSGRLLLRQSLAIPPRRLESDGGRRFQALHIALDRGILVCPTNDGALIAYDLISRGLLWAHAYRSAPLPVGPRLKGLRSKTELEIESIPHLRCPWQVTAPILADGKVIHASADSPAVEVLNLDNGKLLWKSERVADDLFLAGVHDSLVLIINRKHCRALRLEDGKEIWRQATATPSGQGVFAGGAYWLPVKAQGAKSAGLVRVDVARGTVADPLPLPTKALPGNLVVADGMFLSQTVTELAAYGSK